MKKLQFLILSILFFTLFSCEEEKDYSYGDYPFSWLPVTTQEGGTPGVQYTEGENVALVLMFKSFDANPVTAVKIQVGVVDEITGIAANFTEVATLTEADFVYVPEQLQYKVNVNYTVSNSLIDKKVKMQAVIETKNGMSQTKDMATFNVSESIPYLVENMNYYYMFDNLELTDRSAGFTSIVTIQKFYGGFSANLDEIGGENAPGYTPDWVASYYNPVYGYFAQDVYELHMTYHYEAGWYATPKRLASTEFGTVEMIENELIAGNPVIVHGNFRNTEQKHQIIIVGMSATKYIALDPAGKWDGQVNGSYISNSTAGVYVAYPKSNVQTAIGTDGDIWMHRIVEPENESIEAGKTDYVTIKGRR